MRTARSCTRSLRCATSDRADPLRNTEHSVADVCLSVGLSSARSFTTSFGRKVALSPTAYRATSRALCSRLRPDPAVEADTLVPRRGRRARSSDCREDDRGEEPHERQRLGARPERGSRFETEKLGMEPRDDVTLPELGNFRWLTVGVPGLPDVAFTLTAVPVPAGVRRRDAGAAMSSAPPYGRTSKQPISSPRREHHSNARRDTAARNAPRTSRGSPAPAGRRLAGSPSSLDIPRA